MGLIYEQLTYKVRGCIYEVHNELGTGYDEECYQLALEYQLRKSKIPFRSQEVKYIEHKGEQVHKFILDLIVYDKIILELKTIQNNFHPAHIFQLLSYLKCWNKKLGLLVNFGLPKVAIKRLPLFTNTSRKIVEDYSYIKGLVTPNSREFLGRLRAAIFSIFEAHGLGYGKSIYQALLLQELSFRKMDYIAEPTISVIYKNQILKKYQINYPVIVNQFICGITVLKENIKPDIVTTQTYLSALNLSIGLLVHFGKEKLEIYGVCPKQY